MMKVDFRGMGTPAYRVYFRAWELQGGPKSEAISAAHVFKNP